MKFTAFSVVLFLLVAGGVTACSQSEQPPPAGEEQPSSVLVLTGNKNQYPLDHYIDILEDPTEELGINQIASPEYSGKFKSGLGANTNFGITQSAYWVRLKLNNQASGTNEWLLVMSDPRMQYISLFIPSSNGTGFSEKQTGTLRPFSTRDFPDNQFVFVLSLPYDSEQTIYLHFHSKLAMTFPLTIWSWEAYSSNRLTERLKSGIWYGALVILLVYNLSLLFTFRETSFLYYLLFLASALLTQATFEGIAGQYLWPQNMGTNDSVIRLANSMLNLFALKFTDVFLIREMRIRWLTWLNNTTMAVWLASILLGGFIPNITFYNNVLAVVSSTLIVLAGIVALQQGNRQARFFLIAWPGFFIPYSLARLVRLGTLPASFLLPDVHFGLIWLALFWLLALTDRINLLKSATEAAHQALQRNERRLSQFLEAMPVGVTVYGPDRKLRYVNQRSRQILANPERGIQPDANSGRTLDQAVDYFTLRVASTEQTYPVDRLPLSQALRGEPGHADDLEADLVDRRVPLEIWANPVLDEKGEVQYAVAAFQDISDRKAVEQALRESQARLSGILDIAAEAIVSVDEDQNILLYNREAERTFGYTPAEVMGQPLDLLIPARFVAALWEDLAKSERSEEAARILEERQSIYGRRKDGGEFPAEGLISKLELQGELIFTVLLRDVTRRQQVEAELEQHRQNLEGLVATRTEELTRANQQLQSEIAQRLEQTHQLAAAAERNRLARDLHDSVTQILFSANLVAEVLPQLWQRDPRQGRESLGELLRLTRGALAEMRTLLLELRPEALTKTPLGELIAQLTEAVTSRGYLPFELYLENVPPLPGEIHATFYRVAQEALNNAVKHSGASRVSVSLNAAPAQDAPSGNGWRGLVRLAVRDDGVGFQTGALGEEKMGLGIMRERAVAIGADLSIASQNGQGTQVTLTWEN